jgi:hypothetical protein
LEKLFRAKVINLLVEEKLMPVERVRVLYSWKHSGFNMHAGEQVPPEAKAGLEDLPPQNLLHCSPASWKEFVVCRRLGHSEV